MRPNNPFLQLTLPRVETALQRIKATIWQAEENLTVECLPEAKTRLSLDDAVTRTDWQPATPGSGGNDAFAFTWYRFDVPPEGANWLQWQHAAESTIYINGKPYAGFDGQHHYHRIPGNAGTIHVEVMRMSPGQSFQGATLCHRNDKAWAVKHDLEVLFDIAQLDTRHLTLPFGDDYTKAFSYRQAPDYLPRATRRLLRLLDDAATTFEKHGLDALAEALQRAYVEFAGNPQGLQLIATAQAHLDPVHMWPETVGDFKIAHTFSTATRLMDEYPELTFQFSQPFAYEKVKTLEAGLFATVLDRLQEGRWEMEGAFYVESDVNIPCGEALARSMLIGQELSRNYGGKESLIVWVPDTFGYCAALPQIMRQCGVKYFYTTKMQWSPVTHFPYSSFRWKGNDGSEVIAHLSQHYMGYMLNGLPSQMRNVENIYRQSDVHNESIAPVGFGDGGGGITDEQIERVRRIDDLHGAPRTRFGRVRDFFDRLGEKRHALPEFHGEIYLEYHRGVLTSRRRVKELHRALERALQALEAIHSAKYLGPVDDHYWKRLSLMQFHDIVTGSMLDLCADQVNDEMQAMVDELGKQTVNALGRQGEDCVFNPLPCSRQVFHNGEIVSLPPLSGVVAGKAKQDLPPVVAHASGLSNGIVEAEFSKTGEIVSMSVHGRQIHLTGPGNQLTLYREMPAMFDIWEVDRQTLCECQNVDTPANVEMVDHGPNRGELRFHRKIGEHSKATMIYTLDAGASVLQISCEIDWHEPETMLRAEFPTDYQGRMARFGAPFGSVLRPAQPGMPHEEAQWESAGSRWACVADEGERNGLALITKDNYGFSAYKGLLTLSLVHSPIPPECDRERLGRALVQSYNDESAKTVFTDMGFHRIRYAVGLHDINSPREELAPMLADTLYTEVVPYQGKPIDSPLPDWKAGNSLIPCWVRPTPDGPVLRFHETCGQRGTIESSAVLQALDLSGREKEESRRLSYGPHEVIGIRPLPPADQ